MGGADGDVRMGRCGWGGVEGRCGGADGCPNASPGISKLTPPGHGRREHRLFAFGGCTGVCAGAELGVGAAAKQETAPLFSFG